MTSWLSHQNHGGFLGYRHGVQKFSEFAVASCRNGLRVDFHNPPVDQCPGIDLPEGLYLAEFRAHLDGWRQLIYLKFLGQFDADGFAKPVGIQHDGVFTSLLAKTKVAVMQHTSAEDHHSLLRPLRKAGRLKRAFEYELAIAFLHLDAGGG